jgi:NAD(P)-dependent dehydrogenase (short-subunit alcohol dehydrogenase family)
MNNTTEPIVIIGATGGIGKALVTLLKNILPNSPLVLVALHEETLNSTYPQEDTYAVDVTSAEAVADLFDTIKKKYSGVASVVHLVGSILLKPAHITKPEEFETVLQKNLVSSFNTVRSATKLMSRQGHGAIVLSASAAGQLGLPNHDAIAAAKAGVIGLTKSAAATYAGKGIRINCVAPGMVETPLSEKILANPASRQASEVMHPLGRILQPEEVAESIVWLLKSKGVTGQVIGIDAGLSTLKN